MANSRCTLQLLFLGLLVAPAFLQRDPCEIVKSTTPRGSFSLDVSPPTYRPGVSYTVTTSGIDNGTSVILQVRSGGSHSEGLWETDAEAINCGGMEQLAKKNVSGNGTQTRWMSPSNSNPAEVHFRAFVTFANGTTLMQSQTLARGFMTPEPSIATHTGVHRPTHNSTNARLNATMVTHNWASSSHQEHQVPYSAASTSLTCSVLVAALQLLPIFLGFKLLS